MYTVTILGEEEGEDLRDIEDEVQSLEKLLGLRLAEFLDADYNYTLMQISSSIRPHLYRGPSTSTASDKSEKETSEWY